MTEPAAPGASAPRPVPDLGFFAGAPSRGGPFGSAPPSPSVPMAPAGNAPAPSRFGDAAPPGYPPADVAAPQPVVGPGYPPTAYQMAPPPRSGLPGWAIVAICVPVVL